MGYLLSEEGAHVLMETGTLSRSPEVPDVRKGSKKKKKYQRSPEIEDLNQYNTDSE